MFAEPCAQCPRVLSVVLPATRAARNRQVINPLRTGTLVIFDVSNTLQRNWSYAEAPAFVIIGVLGGLYGALFIRANIWWCAFRRRTAIARCASCVKALREKRLLTCFPPSCHP